MERSYSLSFTMWPVNRWRSANKSTASHCFCASVVRQLGETRLLVLRDLASVLGGWMDTCRRTRWHVCKLQTIRSQSLVKHGTTVLDGRQFTIRLISFCDWLWLAVFSFSLYTILRTIWSQADNPAAAAAAAHLNSIFSHKPSHPPPNKKQP